VELLPLKSGELAAALRNAGFSAFDFYGDFKYSDYTEDSHLLVVKAGRCKKYGMQKINGTK